MNVDTGEIISFVELQKRLARMMPIDRERELERWQKLQAFEEEMLRNPSMTAAERIAFKVRGKLASNTARRLAGM